MYAGDKMSVEVDGGYTGTRQKEWTFCLEKGAADGRSEG